MTRHLIRLFLAGAVVIALAAFATPALAQTGTLGGKVVNEDGRPAAAVEVILDVVGDVTGDEAWTGVGLAR